MKNKKLFFLLIFVLITILISLYFIIKNFKTKATTDETDYSEYTPEEEISTEQLRQSTILLYFVNTNNEIQNEKRLVDSAILLKNPYTQLINFLISGPQTDSLKNVFPENVKLLDSKYENGSVLLNFSEEILNYSDDTQKYNIINCILNTLTQLNEVNSIKFLVNNETSNEFDEVYTL